MSDEPIRKGGCLCGAVRYTISGLMRNIVACHCSQCRKQSGHYYAATSTKRENLTIDGSENLAIYRASDNANRTFCKICGSAVFWDRDGSENISVLAGTLDTPTNLKLTHYIFCSTKGDYYDLDDGLEQFSGPDL